jgi:replication factor C subunit 2/4
MLRSSLRFAFLCDLLCQILSRLQEICSMESVSYDLSGLEAIIFTAEGDMRNALNALQSTVSGFGHVSAANVFKVCDQPHPLKIKSVLQRFGLSLSLPPSLSLPLSHPCLCSLCLSAMNGQCKDGIDIIMSLCGQGYAATDIIQTLFRVTRTMDMPEPQKLEFLREIGFSHMRISEGLNTQLQLIGCVSRLAALTSPPSITSS